MRPSTPDGLPIIGPLSDRRDVFVATGHQMLGVTLAPATGRLVANRVLGLEDRAAPPVFEPGRFRPRHRSK
jgi:D-amino-acid dehydrogenase